MTTFYHQKAHQEGRRRIPKVLSLLFLGLLVVGFLASCDFAGTTLSGTDWRYESFGSGVGLKFSSETEGTTEVGLLSTWTDVYSFTYTYNSAAKAGTITLNLTGTSKAFTISGSTLTYDGTTYTKK